MTEYIRNTSIEPITLTGQAFTNEAEVAVVSVPPDSLHLYFREDYDTVPLILMGLGIAGAPVVGAIARGILNHAAPCNYDRDGIKQWHPRPPVESL